MRLLVDEMFSPKVAEQLRGRGHDAVSVHDPDHQWLEGAPDADVFEVAIAEARAVVTANVPDFRRLEAVAPARGDGVPTLIFTTNRQFPRGDAATIGRLVTALDVLLSEKPASAGTMFLEPPLSRS